MVTLFLTPSCTSCRKAKAWFEENEIEEEIRRFLPRSVRTFQLHEAQKLIN